MTFRAVQIGAALLLVLLCAGRSQGQSLDLIAAINATPNPVPPSGLLTTPDPFVSLGGGRCIGGGWYPQGMGGH